MRRALLMISAASALANVLHATASAQDVVLPTEDQVQRMRKAAPNTPPVVPKQPRKVLVWGHFYTHEPVPFAAKAFEVLGEESGSFQAVVSQDAADLLPENLAQYDALIMNNIHERDPFVPRTFGDLPEDEKQQAREQDATIRKGILDFVAGGKGLVGVHAATAALQDWTQYGALMGGIYTSHIYEEVPIKVDEPNHPLNACFGGQGFRINDEIYFLSEQNPRDKYRVLLSLDLDKMDDPGKRPDKDYVISHVCEHGEGRVFYCSLGHASETYWNPLFLAHVLAGVQYAIGDLEADATPSAP